MPAKPILMSVPRSKTSAKLVWNPATDPRYDFPQDVQPWLEDAWEQAQKDNPEFKKSGVPVGYWGDFFTVKDIKGKFRVFGASQSSPKPKVVWFSPWSNTEWSMYLATTKIEYKPLAPVKNG